MSDRIALFRAVNVGGNAILPMAGLRTMAAAIGLENPRTLLQSGNLVFDAGARSPSACEKLLQAACTETFGFTTEIFVRNRTELEAVVAGTPFPKEAKNDPARLHVFFLRGAPAPEACRALEAAIKGREAIKVSGKQAYIYYPDGAGRSKLTAAAIERHLGHAGTARNWNTVTKLLALLRP
ncbi:MAG: DUF1697 domain-containing protein [Rhizomicrobium sp.]